ncbi:MAG: HU family DNA-binding protein [Bryobacteraceae bacterium]|jgi:nucleoid DNA-binding protein
MTKQQLIDAVASTSDRSKQEVEAVVDSLLGEMGKHSGLESVLISAVSVVSW